ncbi:MAG: response regulator [Acidobacteriota bacterium]|jgi:CheY-like chemotaxis protein
MAFHILVVDDDPDVRDVLTRVLRRRGYVVENAADGEEALAAVRAHDPDLMVLDVYLPKLSGLEVLHAIQREDLHTRTIAVSGIPDDEMVRNTEQLGAVTFLAKPFDFPVLTEEIAANLVAAARAADVESGKPASRRRLRAV